ncbi:unnamed protein product, partial [Polarella glacialis]
AAEQVAERRCAPWRAQAAALLDVDLLQEALRRWGSADFEEAAAGLRQRCPALEASTETADGAENQVSARIAQLDFLVDTGAMSGADCLQMVTSWPECLSDFTIRQVWAQDDLVAVNKPFNRLMYCKKRLPREVPVADWLKTGFQGQGQARLCHRLDYGTSGVLLLATSREAANWCAELFAGRKVKKVYHAVVFGHPSWDGQVCLDDPIQGKPSETLVH